MYLGIDEFMLWITATINSIDINKLERIKDKLNIDLTFTTSQMELALSIFLGM